MNVRSTVLLGFTLLALFFTSSALAIAQGAAPCNFPSGSLTSEIDTILYVNDSQADLPLTIYATIDNGVGTVSTVFTANGTGVIPFNGEGRLVSATVNGTTVCHGSTGTTTLPSGDTASIQVGTSSAGRGYISVTVESLQ